jgi:predicted nuclease of predicted toxin-antitoxin system
MKFKIDENLPAEFAELLVAAGHDAKTVVDQCMSGATDTAVIEICTKEGRALVTLDLDFADIRAYPPHKYAGIMVLRVIRQDKRYLLDVFSRAINALVREPVYHRLWIIEENRIRIRTSPA